MSKSLIAVAALAAASLGAQASTITQTFTVTPHTTELAGVVDFGSLNLFDGSLGTLTGAVLTVDGNAVFEFSGKNKASQTQNAKLTSSTDMIFSSDLAAVNAFLAADGFTLSGTSGTQSYAVGETKAFGPLNDSKSSVDDLSSILAALTGTGSFKVQCDTVSGLLVAGGGGNINTTQHTEAGCGANIVYTYTPTPPNQTPEPGSLALAGLAIAGLGFGARRRRA